MGVLARAGGGEGGWCSPSESKKNLPETKSLEGFFSALTGDAGAFLY